MAWVERLMKWLMIVSGLLTFTGVFALVAPRDALQHTFGEALDGPIAEIVVRNWGALIALIGVMLLYGAFRPHVRSLVLFVAATSKLVYIALVLTHGKAYLDQPVFASIAVDLVLAVLFIVYLVITRGHASHGGERR